VGKSIFDRQAIYMIMKPLICQARLLPIREECRNFQSYETPAAFAIIDVGNNWKSLSFINGQDRVGDWFLTK